MCSKQILCSGKKEQNTSVFFFARKKNQTSSFKTVRSLIYIMLSKIHLVNQCVWIDEMNHFTWNIHWFNLSPYIVFYVVLFAAKYLANDCCSLLFLTNKYLIKNSRLISINVTVRLKLSATKIRVLCTLNYVTLMLLCGSIWQISWLNAAAQTQNTNIFDVFCHVSFSPLRVFTFTFMQSQMLLSKEMCIELKAHIFNSSCVWFIKELLRV